jgi:hypothetical protein
MTKFDEGKDGGLRQSSICSGKEAGDPTSMHPPNLPCFYSPFTISRPIHWQFRKGMPAEIPQLLPSDQPVVPLKIISTFIAHLDYKDVVDFKHSRNRLMDITY